MNKVKSIRVSRNSAQIYVDLNNDWDVFNFPKEATTFKNKILSMLRRKGWVIETDEWTNDIYGKQHHWAKVGFHSKSNLEAAFSFNRNRVEINVFQTIYPADREAEKGRWSFGQYKVMDYKMKLYFQLLVNHISKLLKVDAEEVDNPKLAAEAILNHNNTNWHKPKVSCLEEIENPETPQKDKNGKELSNGQTKYFYDWNGRLKRGVIYHNINNMWWVKTNTFNYNNKAAFDLFDYDREPLKNPKRKRGVLENKLKEAVKNMEFSRAEKFKNLLNENNEKLYKVWSIKYGTWWGQNNSGYTSNESQAGIYKESEVSQSYHNNGKDSRLVEIKTA